MSLASDGRVGLVANVRGQILTAVFDAAGKRSWSASYETTTADDAYGVAMGLNGEVWVVGRSASRLGVGPSSIFALKYDAQGRLAWSRPLPGAALESGRIALAEGGNRCVVAATGAAGAVVSAYDRDGVRLWSDAYPGPVGGFLTQESIRLSPTGDAYVSLLERSADKPSRLVLRKYDPRGGPAVARE